MAGIDNLVPFKKGEDPRRGSKPKGSKHLSTWIQEMMNDEEFETLLIDPKKGYIDYKGAPLKAVIKTAILKSVAGDKQWADWLANNGWKQQLDITTNGKDLPTPILGGLVKNELPADDSNDQAE